MPIARVGQWLIDFCSNVVSASECRLNSVGSRHRINRRWGSLDKERLRTIFIYGPLGLKIHDSGGPEKNGHEDRSLNMNSGNYCLNVSKISAEILPMDPHSRFIARPAIRLRLENEHESLRLCLIIRQDLVPDVTSQVLTAPPSAAC